MPENIAIIGAGLAGSLLAVYLGRRGFEVDVYEARGDVRKEGFTGGRSINLALSDRGIAALHEVGMDEYMLSEAVPMYGRMVHSEKGETSLLRYSGREGEYINSVSRGGLNLALIDRAGGFENVRFHFNCRCVDYDLGSGEIVFGDGTRTKSDTTIACDGAGSAIRIAIEKNVPSFRAAEKWLEHGYKELHIPPGKAGDFQLEKNALHIWPRHKFMMIALPNRDGSFTCTLFLTHKSDRSGEPSFQDLQDHEAVVSLFCTEFPDAIPLMPDLLEDFFTNPTGSLGTLKCGPWNVNGRVLLMGDAAHAMVPFYGQGMNCAFEDVRILDTLIDKHGTEWSTICDEFYTLRKQNADAICDMAEENFYEMRDAVADPVFVRKRKLETVLEHTFPDYFSKYSMVTFREDLPYVVAKEFGNEQDKLLMEICRPVGSIDELDLDEVMQQVRQLGRNTLTRQGGVA